MMPALTIFLGSFLLFLVQPLVGNMLLPVFGGTSAVWIVCLVTFQMLLVGGYFYAHLACGRNLRPRTLRLHCAAILLAGILTAYVAVKGDAILGVFGQIGNPAWGSLCAVAVLVGFPYILLSANTSLVQMLAGGNYRLYAVSNAGSLCGLMSYPFILEPFFKLGDQWLVFTGGLVIYAVMLSILGWRQTEVGPVADVRENQITDRVECGAFAWFLLSAASSLLLNAVTAHLSSDVAPLPLLWTLVLAAYLASWIVAFTNLGSKILPIVSAVVLPLVLFAVWHTGIIGYAGWLVELGLGGMIVFLGGWVVHASLYHLRPSGSKLTAYYLQVALGGACGGFVASLLLPALFDFIVEYPVGLAMVAALCVWNVGRGLAERRKKIVERGIVVRAALAVFLGVMIWGVMLARRDEGTILRANRNFYGVVRVLNRYIETTNGDGYWAHVLKNSGTDHGFQLAEGEWKSRLPTAYFGSQAGGLAFERHPRYARKESVRAAVCGLGIGALAAYVRRGDFLRFYEINPAVAEIASDPKLFSFVSDAEGTVEIVVDDARKALEKERAAGEKKYDILVVDVFSGDAIPPQMVTQEAFSLYLDRLENDGILAMHISSWHLDLLPIVKAAAKRFNLNLQGYRCMGDAHTYCATWVFLSRSQLPDYYNKKMHIPIDFNGVKNMDMPEDERHPLIGLLDFFGRRQKK